ncbi:histone-lysine N-methyltransferase family member SUVH9-like [Triticum aestivum]|uniref:histone-lysine N-methyltransferase family member SUVH9-like n=1 Tax=Triticum aestivum TaxID=4565 RepID=UPI001D014F31|nr:histone-lysine N-methyltransferase family member SUVH9-like [Triticum aestivum]
MDAANRSEVLHAAHAWTGGRRRNDGDDEGGEADNEDAPSRAVAPGNAGQEQLGSMSWCLAKDMKDKIVNQVLPHGYISPDLSKGNEVFSVPIFNDVDEDRSLLDFDYIAHPKFPLSLVPPPVKLYQGCRCVVCGSDYSCLRKNGGGAVYNEDGTLIRGRPVVYECGALCGCTTRSCFNRSTQVGMEHRLEVFRSMQTDWGVRTLDLIQPGAFVCEYSGDVVTGDVTMDEGCVIDPKRFPKKWREWGYASDALLEDKEYVHIEVPQAVLPDTVCESVLLPQFPHFQEPGYILDVSRRRNFASYISHSCIPNAFVQFVIRAGENQSCTHLMVFAMDVIPPMRELSIDYGIDQQICS